MRMKFTAVQITKNLNLLHFIRSMRKKVWKFSQLIRMTTWNSKYERANCVLAPVDNSILYMTHTVKPRNWQMHAPGYMPVKSSPRSHWWNPYIQLCFFQSITLYKHRKRRGEKIKSINRGTLYRYSVVECVFKVRYPYFIHLCIYI